MNGLADVQDCLNMYVNTLRVDCPFREAIETSIDRHNCATGPNLSHCKEHNMLYGLKVIGTSQQPLKVGYIMPNRTGFIVSGTELLKCHAFTDCLLFIYLPKGVRPETFCTPRGNFQILLQIPICENAGSDRSKSLAATPTPLGNNPTQVVDSPDTSEGMQDESVAPLPKKASDIARLPTMLSLKSPSPGYSHLPAVRISDDDREVQPTAEWTQPPPGLKSSGDKDDDPIESFSGSPPFYHQQQTTIGNTQAAPDISKNSSQSPLAPIIEDDDEIQISSALSAVSLCNQKGLDNSAEKSDTHKGDKPTRQHPYLRCSNLQSKHEQRAISQVSTGSTIEHLLCNGGHQHVARDARCQPTSGNRRSKSADWNSACIPKKGKKLASSKSCPPSRIRFSPGKEVVKIAAKVDRSDRVSHRKVDGNEALTTPALKATVVRKPLIRRAGQTNTIPSFFVKPVEVPVPMEIEDDLQKEHKQPHVDIVDVENSEHKQKMRDQANAVAKVNDASNKWLGNIEVNRRNTVEITAVQILLSMHATFCYYVVAMRLLTKAPWTENMVSIDVRQAALVAISKGWYLYSNTSISFPFSTAELAIAAGLYNGSIEPAAQDDVTHGLKVIIDHLPQECDTFFTKAKAHCPSCGASTTGLIHILSTPTTWIAHGWTSLKDTVFNAEPLLGRTEGAWHKPKCERPEATFTIDKLGCWIYLELRPMCRLSTTEQNADFFPPITSVRSILSDVSLQEDSIEITGFVCSDISEWPNAHYWLVEVINGQIQGVYDSLKGPQHLTTDVGKKLRVTGLLLCKTSVTTPKMCSVLLDEAAGRIPSTMRQTRPIKVHCRQKVLTLRKFLKKDLEKQTDKRRASSKSKLNTGGSGKKLPNTSSTDVRKLGRGVNRDAIGAALRKSHTCVKTKSSVSKKENIVENCTAAPNIDSKSVTSPSDIHTC